MMEIGAFEAKNRLGELIRKVQDGERIVITHRGKPAAMLVSPTPPLKDAGAAIDALIAFGKRRRLALTKGETLRSLIDQGRK